MAQSTFLGIDPGLVHTGIVSISIDCDRQSLEVGYTLLEGFNVVEIKGVVSPLDWDAAFVESYRTRSNYATNDPMVSETSRLLQAIPGLVKVNNMGIKKIINQQVLKAFACDRFPVPSNHGDLQSAARIALFGAAKDEEWNRILYQYLSNEKKLWTVQKHSLQTELRTTATAPSSLNE